MCGLWGMIQYKSYGFDNDSRDAVLPAMLLTSQRGVHSTGMFGVSVKDKKDKISYVKKVGSPYMLMMEPDTKKFMEKVFREFHAVVGHGRFATKGDITAQNAHPFHEGNIVLVHNGGIHNLYDLKFQGKKVDEIVDVDSHACALLLNEMEPKQFFKEVRGAFAFIWYDRRTHCLYTVRNNQRPLFCAMRKDVPEVFFASEIPTLKYIRDKFDMQLDNPLEVEEGHLYTWPLGERSKIEFDKEKLQLHQWSQPVRGGWDNYDMFGEEGAYRSSTGSGRGRMHRRAHDGVNLNTHMWDSEKRIYVPRPDPVQPPSGVGGGKKAEGNLTRYRHPMTGYQFRKGEYVAFYPNDGEQMNKDERDSTRQHFVIRGLSVPSDEVSVFHHCTGRDQADALQNEVVVAGRIDAMYFLHETAAPAKVRCFVKEIITLPTELQNKLMQPGGWEDVQLQEEIAKITGKQDSSPALDDINLSLKNGDKISYKRFKKLADDGCVRCGSLIDDHESGGSLMAADAERVGLVHEKELKDGGLFCPKCVLRDFSH